MGPSYLQITGPHERQRRVKLAPLPFTIGRHATGNSTQAHNAVILHPSSFSCMPIIVQCDKCSTRFNVGKSLLGLKRTANPDENTKTARKCLGAAVRQQAQTVRPVAPVQNIVSLAVVKLDFSEIQALCGRQP